MVEKKKLNIFGQPAVSLERNAEFINVNRVIILHERPHCVFKGVNIGPNVPISTVKSPDLTVGR